MKILTVTLLIAVALVIYRSVVKEAQIPRPEYFVWIAVVWALMGLLADFLAPELAAVFSVGLVMALAYTYLTTNDVPSLASEETTS